MNIMSFALGLPATVAVCAVAARSEPFTANKTRDASEFHTVELYRRYKEDSGKRLGEEEFVVELLKCTPFLTSWHEPGAMGGIDFKFTPLKKYKYIQKLEETGKIDRDKLTAPDWLDDTAKKEFERVVAETAKAVKDASTSKDPVLYIKGVYPSGKKGYFAVELQE